MRDDELNPEVEGKTATLEEREVSNDSTDAAPPEKPKLSLGVTIQEKSACERHVTVIISRADIDRYYSDEFTKIMPKAAVPGFRAGRAPRKLIEARFRKDLADQVKGALLIDSLGQVTDEHRLSPISEPEFDPVAVEIPSEGPMTFEFDLEVRPVFEPPVWKGLTIDRPVREIQEADIDRELREQLTERGRLTPVDRPVAVGDYVSVNLRFTHGEKVLSSANEEVIRVRDTLSFRDGKIEHFGALMKGARAGETRVGEAELTHDAPNPELRGKKVTATFEILEVKKLELPEIDAALLESLGDFHSLEELRDSIRQGLLRKVEFAQRQRAREQILLALTVTANWDLPPHLLRRQAKRELERSVMEYRRNGFSEREIRLHENALRQNSLATTARALKEHFILERISEDEKIEDTPDDYDSEIELIAKQSGDSTRRTRAQIEKRGLMDVLRNQIIERKTIDLILAHAKFRDVPFEFANVEAEALEQTAGGGEEPENPIPEAKYTDQPENKELS